MRGKVFVPPQLKNFLRSFKGIEQFLVLFDGVAIRHTCYVIADRAFESALFDEELNMIGQHGRLGLIGMEQV